MGSQRVGHDWATHTTPRYGEKATGLGKGFFVLNALPAQHRARSPAKAKRSPREAGCLCPLLLPDPLLLGWDPSFSSPLGPEKKLSLDEPLSASPPSGRTPDCRGPLPGSISAPPSTNLPVSLPVSSLGSLWRLLHHWRHFFPFPWTASLGPSHTWGEVSSSTFPLPGCC